MVDGTAANMVTNAVTGEPFAAQQRQNAFEQIMALQQVPQGPAPSQRPGFFSRWFGGDGTPPAGAEVGQPQAAAVPSPAPQEMPMAAAGAGEAPAAPVYASMEAVAAAVRQGMLTRELAREILVNQFGFDP
jgi:hypothetical protein